MSAYGTKRTLMVRRRDMVHFPQGNSSSTFLGFTDLTLPNSGDDYTRQYHNCACGCDSQSSRARDNLCATGALVSVQRR